MAQHLDKATCGEQGAGFFLGPQGYFLVDGPSGTQGHAANACGFDGVAYCIERDDLIIYDNKAFESSRNVGQGTAIDPAANLARNLDGLISKVQLMGELPAQPRILDLLRQTRLTVTSKGVNPPPNVRIAITNSGGNSAGVTKGFAGRGITFIDMNKAPSVPPRPARIYLNKETIPSMVEPATGDVEAYQSRQNKMAAAAEVTRFIAQGANDISLRMSINREIERLTPNIADAIVRGRGALVVININATSPLGSVGMVISRSVSSAYVIPSSTDRKQAVKLFDSTRRWEINRPSQSQLEIQLLWVAPPDVE